MAETRWQITDPQNRIRRLGPVADGTVNVEIVLPADDAATVRAVEAAAAEAGIELARVTAERAPSRPAMTRPHAQVVIDGVEYRPVLRS